MIDYPAALAVAAVVRTGSFEKAARALAVTPSAVSQRVRQLEERLGAPLVERGKPCTATEQGVWLCRHVDLVGKLEADLADRLPGLADGRTGPVTVAVAVNADSLGTWFLPAVAAFTARSDVRLDVTIDDQDHTADWLRRGRVLAAVTSMGEPVAGCRSHVLGRLRYRATASPGFVRRHFAAGVTADALARAPALTYNQKDRLQLDWMAAAAGAPAVAPAPHWLPSTQGFVDACLLGIGWGMNPERLVEGHMAAGRLVELIPGAPLDVPLHWQVSRLAADLFPDLTRDLVAAAGRELHR